MIPVVSPGPLLLAKVPVFHVPQRADSGILSLGCVFDVLALGLGLLRGLRNGTCGNQSKDRTSHRLVISGPREYAKMYQNPRNYGSVISTGWCRIYIINSTPALKIMEFFASGSREAPTPGPSALGGLQASTHGLPEAGLVTRIPNWEEHPVLIIA